MLAKDYKELTYEQLYIEDEQALTMAKRTLKVFADTYNVSTKDFPKPDTWVLYELLEHYRGLTKVNPDIELVNTACAATAITYRNRDLDMCLSCLAYFLAIQDISLKSVNFKWKDLIDSMEECKPWGRQAYCFSSNIPYENLDITLWSTQKVSEQVSSELPLELVKHLENFPTMEESILEACRIMMLGPKTKRAESAVGSLVNAWNIMQKTK